jgi:hypothetical protein
MAKKKLPEIEIIELFLVKGDWHRTFMAQITREITADGREIIYGKVVVNEGAIYAIGNTEDELGTYLDDLCVMKLDYGLHENAGIIIKIGETEFFLN